MNGPGIAGLLAGLLFLKEQSLDHVARHGALLRDRLQDGLRAVEGVRVLSPRQPDALPIVTFTTDTVDAATLAGRLDREFGVLCRHGLHCAPEAHRVLGTIERGAVRFSAGWSTTAEEIDRAVHAVAQLLATPRGKPAGLVV